MLSLHFESIKLKKPWVLNILRVLQNLNSLRVLWPLTLLIMYFVFIVNTI